MLARLVEDLGTLAHAERGVMALRKEPTDVSLLVYDAVRALEPESRARGVEHGVEAPADLGWSRSIRCGCARWSINLVANAIRHSHGGAEPSRLAGHADERLAGDRRE